MIADIVVDLQYGDCGKGKVTHHLCKSGEYTHVIRYNGGCNAGHTIYHHGIKFTTHHIPAGVFLVLNLLLVLVALLILNSFLESYATLKKEGWTPKILYSSLKTHILSQINIWKRMPKTPKSEPPKEEMGQLTVTNSEEQD